MGTPYFYENRMIVFHLFHFLDNSLESLGIIHGQIGKHLTVDFDSGFMNSSHQFGVRHAFEARGGIDTLNPQCAEVAFIVFAVAISIGQTFFPCVFGNGPHVFTRTIVTAGKFKNFFSFCS